MGVVGGSVEGPTVADEPPVTEITTATPRVGSHWLDVLGVLWVVAAACVALVPAFVHGPYFGAFDLLSRTGLTARPGGVIHNAALGDQVNEVVPWITLAWTQVHNGHLPLWNPFEALGMPLAFNWGSGAFGLPALVSYLTPLRAVYWVQILVSLIVGGTGAYFFGRVLRLHPVACAFAGTTWVLSGPLFGYLGLPDTSVMSWAGWQFAAVVLIFRGTHRLRAIALFAVSFAFSILAGNPQIEVVIALALGVFVVVMLVGRTGALRGSGPIRRPIVDLVVAGIAGGALAAPLVLPGLQLANASVRNSSFGTTDRSNPVSQLLATVFQSFWGQPISGRFISSQGYLPEQWAYVGAIALALSVVAVAVRWRRPEVVGLAAAVVVTAAASVLQPADRLLEKLPLVGSTYWVRGLIPLAFCLAMLAAIGLDAVLRQSERRRAARWGLGAFGAIAVLLGLLWLFGRGSLSPHQAHVRADSFVWPVVSTVVGLAAFGTLVVIDRRPTGKEWSRKGLRRLSLGCAGVVAGLPDGVPGRSSMPLCLRRVRHRTNRRRESPPCNGRSAPRWSAWATPRQSSVDLTSE